MKIGKPLIARDIYNTRKLNNKEYNLLKNKGINGDTELNIIDGKLSHVTQDENTMLKAADIIDIDRSNAARKYVEEIIAREGVGTLNPETNLPQYYNTGTPEYDYQSMGDGTNIIGNFNYNISDAIMSGNTNINFDADMASQGYLDEEGRGDAIRKRRRPIGGFNRGAQGAAVAPPPKHGRKSYDELVNMTDEERARYLQDEFGLSSQHMQYIKPFQDKPFEFLDTRKTIDTGMIETQGLALVEQGKQLDLKEDQLDLNVDQLNTDTRALSQSFAEGFSNIYGGGAGAMKKTGLATSGTITANIDSQLKNLTKSQDITMEGFDTKRAGFDIERLGYGIDRNILGLDKTLLDYRQDEVDLAYDKGVYGEKEAQEEKFYTDVGNV